MRNKVAKQGMRHTPIALKWESKWEVLTSDSKDAYKPFLSARFKDSEFT